MGAPQPRLDGDIHDQFLKGTRAIIDGTKAAGVLRFDGGRRRCSGLRLACSGAADTLASSPPKWKQGALVAREALN